MKKILRGQVSIITLLSIIGSAIVGTATAVAWNVNYVNSQITPVQVAEQQDQTAIASINVKLDFILGKYGAQYDTQTEKVIVVTSTAQQ